MYFLAYYLHKFLATIIGLIPAKWLRNLSEVSIRDKEKLHSKSSKQLLIDVSIILQDDARTGIQRVVRALYNQLLKEPPEGYLIRPVFATRKRGYRYAPLDFLQIRRSIKEMNAQNVSVTNGDVFLSLDLATHLLPLRFLQLLSWKWRGVIIYGFVYDLLPLKYPDWFDARLAAGFKIWIKIVAIFSNRIFCISNVVKREVETWLCQNKISDITVIKIPLGADIESSMPDKTSNPGIDQLFETVPLDKTILVVGTMEPRKGHKSVLDAFSILWEEGADIYLFFVGRQGWKMDAFIKAMQSHDEYNKRFFWLKDASDYYLQQLYKNCRGLIMASEAEGLGLPLIEATNAALPVLARDKEVFRENQNKDVTFFTKDDAQSFSKAIKYWHSTIPLSKPKEDQKIIHSWAESAAYIKTCILR